MMALQAWFEPVTSSKLHLSHSNITSSMLFIIPECKLIVMDRDCQLMQVSKTKMALFGFLFFFERFKLMHLYVID